MLPSFSSSRSSSPPSSAVARSLRVLSPLIVFVVLAAHPALASAQEEAAAEALFRSAREAADRGDWVTACDRFEESNRLEPAPGTIFNLAKCREELGQIASAWKRYGEVVQKLPAGDPRVAYARDKERSLEPEVPRLVLLRPEGPEAVTVTVNGMSVKSAMFGVSLPFDPGTLSVVVSAPGHEDGVEQIELARGERVERQLSLGPKSESPSHPAVTTTNSSGVDAAPSSAQRTWGFVALGVGAAGLLAGGSGFIWAAAESSTVDQNCLGDACQRSGFDAAERGQSAVTLGWVGLGVGLLGVGVGSFLLATDDDGGTVAISAKPLFGGAALSIGGTL